MHKDLTVSLQDVGVWVVMAPGTITPGRAQKLRATGYSAAVLKQLQRRFAIIRMARDASGLHNPTTGVYIATVMPRTLPDGLTQFDMITEHESYDAALLHVTAIYALETGR